MTVTVRRIEENETINAGDTLIWQPPIGKAKRVKVTRKTKQYIFIGESKWRRDGSQVGDQFRRCRLFVESK